MERPQRIQYGIQDTRNFHGIVNFRKITSESNIPFNIIQQTKYLNIKIFNGNSIFFCNEYRFNKISLNKHEMYFIDNEKTIQFKFT